MDIKAFIFILLIITVSSLMAQNQIQVEDEEVLYWHPDVEIEYSHFQSESDEECIKYNEKYGVKMSAHIQLYGIVDIPKSHLSRKLKKRTGFDKLYLAPIFCKNCSCTLLEDSVELVVNQLLFDVAEMSARGLRRELIDTQKQTNINNVNTMFYTTVKNKWDERMREVWGAIYQDVLIQKKDSAYIEWRTFVNEMLETNKDFETKPYEIERLISGKPTEKGYLQANTIMGDFKNNGED